MSEETSREYTNTKQNNAILEAIKRMRKFYKDPLTKYPLPFYLQNDENVLILSPHPDDESIGCGGLLVQYPTQCRVVCLTDGRLGDINFKQDELANLREREFKNAMLSIGVADYSLLNIYDGELWGNYKKVAEISFDNIDYIFIPNVFDQHPDHKAVGNHIKRMIENGVIRENIIIAQYEVWNPLVLPTHYNDISNVFIKKKELISKYIQQIKHIDYHERMISLNYFRGMGTGVEFAECYLFLDALSFLNAIR